MPDPTYSQIEAAVAAYDAQHPFYETHVDRDAIKAALIAAQAVDRNIYGDCHFGGGADSIHFMTTSEEARDKIMNWNFLATERLPAIEQALQSERRRGTDGLYMIEALVQMLGPKARKVWKAWQDKGVVRQHSSWTVDPMTMAGEDVAQVHLDMEVAIKNAVPIDDVDRDRFDVV